MPTAAVTRKPAISAETLAAVDLVDVEIFQRKLYSIAAEMGAIMIRTSGDPTISEAVDFSTFIADAEGEIIAFSGYMTWHFGPARQTVRHLLEVIPSERIRPGDAFICNDPHTTGACHAPDVGIVRPIFRGEELLAWCWAEAHLLDVGGVAPGGFSPEARECYAEGLRFPGIKIVSEGVLVDDVVRLIEANFRVPARNLNDLRCFIAACNVCDERLQEVFAEYGPERFGEYNEISKGLSERAMRKRIAALPDGTRTSSGYVEHDGHANDLYEVRMEMTVEGDRMTIDLTGSSPQSGGFINLSRGGATAVAITPMLMSLAPDVPINEGTIRAFEVITPEGTIVNPTMPAPCSSGHVETGSCLSRLVQAELAELQAASADPFVSTRAIASWGECLAGAVFYAPDEGGTYHPFLDLNGIGCGGGAAMDADGIDTVGYLTALQTALPDVEINESQYPVLYLWRRLAVGSSGAGAQRGGLGIEFAFLPWRTVGGVANVFTNSWQLPPRGAFGGYPPGTGGFRHVTGTDVEARVRGGEMPLTPAAIGGSVHELEAKEMGVPVKPGEVMIVRVGGGAGYGDPLDREPAQVVDDIRSGYIPRQAGARFYGVELDGGELDAAATERLRAATRAERRGWEVPEPYRGAAAAAGTRTPIHPALDRVEDGAGAVTVCRRCDTALGAGGEDFRPHLATRRSPAAEVAALYGAEVIARPGVDLVERACPGCGTMIAVDLLIEP